MGFCEYVDTTLNRTKRFGLICIFCGLVAITLKIIVPVYNCCLPENNSTSLPDETHVSIVLAFFVQYSVNCGSQQLLLFLC